MSQHEKFLFWLYEGAVRTLKTLKSFVSNIFCIIMQNQNSFKILIRRLSVNCASVKFCKNQGREHGHQDETHKIRKKLFSQNLFKKLHLWVPI